MKRLALLVLLFLAACNMCGEHSLSQADSPTAQHVAIVFRRGCGASGGFLYHVNIRSADSSFSADHRGVIEDGQVFLTREGLINVRWKDEKTLVIDCEGCPESNHPDNKLPKWKDINIEYQFRARTDTNK